MADAKEYGGSGTYLGYHVEVRLKPDSLEHSHVVTERFVVTKEWTRVPVIEVPFWGTRNELWEWGFYPHAKELSLMRWETANAIAAQVAADSHMHSFLFEFRFTVEEVKHSYTHRQIETSATFTFSDMHKSIAWEKLPEVKA